MGKWTDLAVWIGTDHHGGPMTEHRGLVVHIAEGFYEGTIAWQQDAPAGQRVSSHFIVARDGRCAQMVDTSMSSWAQKDGNSSWLSVECEGFSLTSQYHADHPGWEVLTDQQIEVIGQLLRATHDGYGVPIQIATNPDGMGLGHHSMGGDAWGHLDCPGNPIIAQKPLIIAAALQEDDMPSVDEIWNKQVTNPYTGEKQSVAALLEYAPSREGIRKVVQDELKDLKAEIAGMGTQIDQILAILEQK